MAWRWLPQSITPHFDSLANLTDKSRYRSRRTGGWRSLMVVRPLSEWVVQELTASVDGVSIQEGCINHALPAQAIANDGLPLCWLGSNQINPGLAHYAGNRDAR